MEHRFADAIRSPREFDLVIKIAQLLIVSEPTNLPILSVSTKPVCAEIDLDIHTLLMWPCARAHWGGREKHGGEYPVLRYAIFHLHTCANNTIVSYNQLDHIRSTVCERTLNIYRSVVSAKLLCQRKRRQTLGRNHKYPEYERESEWGR